MQITVSENGEDSAWDHYLNENSYGHHEQSSRFAVMRKQSHFDHFRIVASEGDSVVGGAQVLVRRTPIGNHALLSQGPLINEQRLDIAEELIPFLDEELKKRKISKVSLYTCYPCNFSLEKCQHQGFSSKQNPKSSRFTSLINLKEDSDTLLSKIPRKVRYNIRFASRKGVCIQTGTRSDLQDFYSILTKTARYKGFPIFPFEYFEYLWDLFASNERLVLLLAKVGDTTVGSTIFMKIGNCVYNGWSGVDRDVPDTKASYLLQWEAIQTFKAMGIETYDLGGISLNSGDQVREFKQFFGGKVYQYPTPLVKYYGKGGKFTHLLDHFVDKNDWVQRKISSLQLRLYGRIPY